MMSESMILSECFEEVPLTPGSQSILCVEDFGEASPMVSGFCGRLNQEEYEKQGNTETEKALQVKHFAIIAQFNAVGCTFMCLVQFSCLSHRS